jgi:flagellin
MGFRIGTNVPAISAQRNLAHSEKRVSHATRALASGTRIVEAGDDAAGFAIAENLRGQAASLNIAKYNADNAKGLAQVAEGGLSEQNNILVRLREIAMQGASDTVGDTERGYLDQEFQQLLGEFNRIAETTTFGQKKLLTGVNKELEFHIGTSGAEQDIIRFKLDADTRASSLKIDELSVAERGDAVSVLKDLDSALQSVTQARAGFGAIQSRLEIAGNSVDLQRENILAARSRIADADVAYETSELVQGQIQQEFGVSVLAQANQGSQRALKLLI